MMSRVSPGRLYEIAALLEEAPSTYELQSAIYWLNEASAHIEQLERASQALVDACDKKLPGGSYHMVELQVDTLLRLLPPKEVLGEN